MSRLSQRSSLTGGLISLAMGAATSVAVRAYARPALVSLIKTGFSLNDAWKEVNAEMASIREEEAQQAQLAQVDQPDAVIESEAIPSPAPAQPDYTRELVAELKQLREELATVRAELAQTKSA
jgi:hypothetical protein